MNLSSRLFLGIVVGLSTYFAFLVGGQFDLANEAMSVLKSCESNPIQNCISSQEYSRLVNRWDGNVKVYWVINVLCALAAGYFAPKFKKK